MNYQESLLLCRGAGGVGCWTLNRNFVRELGTDEAFIVADMIRAYAFGGKIHTNKGSRFLWNPTSMMSVCRWSEQRLRRALRRLQTAEVFSVEDDGQELWIQLNFDFLDEIGGPTSLRGLDYDKKARQ